MARKRKQRSSEPTANQPQQESYPETIQEVEEEEVEEQDHEQQEQQQQQEEEQQGDKGGGDEEPAQEEQEQQPETLDSSIEAVAEDPVGLGSNEGGDKEETGYGGEENAKEEDLLDEEPLEKLLEPFGKDQLMTILRKAVDKHPDVMGCVREFADADPALRKIFVHGLGWDTTAETLKSEFERYGEIEDCKAVTDRVSGKSKGYAFILYKSAIGARKALKEPQKKIGSRIASCQLATAGPAPVQPPTTPVVSEYTQRKIFVSNVSADVDPEKLLQFFRQFGEIEEGPLGLDKLTGKPKGFALFVYKSVESAKRALEIPYKNFDGQTLHCQKAIDTPKYNKQGFGNSSGGGHHQHHQHHHHQPHYQHSAKKGKFNSSASGPGHLMAPSGSSPGFNPGMVSQGMNPAIGQALTALIASQGAGLGLGNLLGTFGGAPVNQGLPPAGYGNQAGAAYGNQQPVQGGYMNPQINPQIGQGGGGRSQQGGPYMGQ